MGTVRDLLNGSLRLIGAIAAGETPTAQEQADALSVLLDMLDSWSTEGLTVYQRTRREFNLTPNGGRYSIGPSGNFDSKRPLKIESAWIKDESVSPAVEFPVSVLNLDEWSSIQVKDLTSSLPTHLYYDDSYPLGSVNVWPAPARPLKLVLYTWEPLDTFASVNDEFDFPPGYRKAIRYNLAIELASEYEREPSASVVANANDSKANIKRMNSKPRYLAQDPAVLNQRSTFDWRTGG